MRVFIDTDCGFDDMAAIAMVAAQPAFDIVGLGLVAGNAPLPTVIDNAARMAAFFGWTMPQHAGRDRPLLGPLVTAQDVLGEDALKSAGRTLPPAPARLSGLSAHEALSRAAEGGSLDVLALGPLTNVAVALLADRALAGRLGRVIWMGGSAGAGNHTAAAEFNAAVDPEAVQVVIESGVRLTMVGLDACRTVPVTLDDVARCRSFGGERAETLADLLEGYVRIAQGRPMALYDPVAAAALVAPDLVEVAPAHVRAECAGAATRGMTVCEFRARKAEPNALVARRAEAARVIDLMLDAFASASRGSLS
ncbi:nucleoside hydrolase [Alsobacter sp. R-9]